MLTIMAFRIGNEPRPEKKTEIVRSGIVSYIPRAGALGALHDMFVRLEIARRGADRINSTPSGLRATCEQIMLAAAEAGLADCVYDPNVVGADEQRRREDERKR